MLLLPVPWTSPSWPSSKQSRAVWGHPLSLLDPSLPLSIRQDSAGLTPNQFTLAESKGSLLQVWGRKKFSSTFLGSFIWSTNQLDIRQINKRKRPDLIAHVYMATPHTRDVQRQKGKMRYVWHSEPRMRSGAWASVGREVIAG